MTFNQQKSLQRHILKPRVTRMNKDEEKLTGQPADKIISDLFDYRKMASMKNFESTKAVSNHGSRKVTASNNSRLYGCFFNKDTRNLFTIDENCLVRIWDL